MNVRKLLSTATIAIAISATMGMGIANAETIRDTNLQKYCSPSVGCAGNDRNGNPIKPRSVAPDTSTLAQRASCLGGIGASALSGGVLGVIGAGFTLLGCSGA